MAAPMTTNGTPPAASPSPTFAEAPASATLRTISPTGYDIMWTVRADSVKGLTERVAFLAEWLGKQGYTPTPARPATGAPSTAGQGNGQAQGEGEPAAICDTCGRPMKQKPRRDGKGYFWSCETKYGAEWCKGRPRK